MFTIILKVSDGGTQARILRQDFRNSKDGNTIEVLRISGYKVISSDYPDLRWDCFWGMGSEIRQDNVILVHGAYEGEIKRAFHEILVHDSKLIRERLSL